MLKNKQQIEKKKNLAYYWSQYLVLMLQLKLHFSEKQICFHKHLITCIIVLSSLQQVSFAFETFYFKDMGFQNFIISLTYLTRPYILLDYWWSKYTFLFPLGLLILQQLIFLYFFQILIRGKKQNRISLILQQQKRIVIWVLQFIDYLQSFLYYLTFIPLIEMIIKSILFIFNNSMNVTALVAAIFTLIIILIDSFYFIFSLQQSIQIRVKNLQFLKQDFNQYLNLLFFLIITGINQISIEQSFKFYFITSILIIKQIVNIWNLFTKFKNSLQRMAVELLSETFALIVTLVLIFLQITKLQTPIKDYESLLIIILTPVGMNIVYIFFLKYHENLMNKFNDWLDPGMLQYRLSTLVDEYSSIRKSFVNSNQKIIEILNFKELHSQECQTPTCICNQQEPFLEQIVNLYMKDLVEKFYIAIDKIKDQNDKQMYFIHYLSLIHYLGLSARAFRQANIFTYQDSDNLSSSVSKTQNNMVKIKSNSSVEHQSSGQKTKINKTEEKIRIKFEDMNYILKQRLLVVQELIKKTLSTGFLQQESSALSDGIEHAVKLFLQSEESNQKIKQKIIKLIIKKKEFFMSLTTKNQNHHFFNQAKSLIHRLTQLEDELMKLYVQFPSRKMQALNTFYLSEVMNNYFLAFKLATVTSIADEKLYKMQSLISFDLFSNKINYLIIGFDSKYHKMTIKSSSNQIHEFFGYKQEQFKLIVNIDCLLPQNFEQIHSRLVSNFLSSGQSKYFRQIDMNYCRFQQRFIKQINLFYDVNINNLEDLTFACFLQNSENLNAFLFCSQGYKVQGITKNFVQKLGFPIQLIKKVTDVILHLPVSRLFPKLANLSETNIGTEDIFSRKQVFDQCEFQLQMNLPDFEYIYKTNSSKQLETEQSSNLQYSVDAVFHYRKFHQENYQYLIVEIIDCRRIEKTMMTPQDTSHVNPTSKISESQPQEIEEFYELELFEDFELQPNQPRAIEFKGTDKVMNENNDFGVKRIGFDNNSHSFYPNVSLISPKDATQQLIDGGKSFFYDSNSKRMQNINQQFFQAQDQKDISSNAEDVSYHSDCEISNKQKNQIDQLQIEDIDQELRDNLKMQMQIQEQNRNVVGIDDVGSQVSSAVALQKSKYSKKYDLIQKLILSKNFSNQFLATQVFLTGLFIIFCVFSIFEIQFSTDDLNSFLGELDMIQIKSNIMGPADNYIVAQNAVLKYYILNIMGLIDKETQTQQQLYAQNDISFNYITLKANYIKQLQNRYLDPFFNNQYVTVRMSDVFNVSNHNVSAREAIYLQLEAAFEFDLVDYTDIANSLDPTDGFFVYLFANYQVFYQGLTRLNVGMLSSTLLRANTVKDKWIALLIPISIIGFLLLIITSYYYYQYLQQYNEILSLFQNIEMVWLQRDIDRYRGITQLVEKDSDVLFKYQFDIDLKEQFLSAEEIRKERLSQNQNIRSKKQKFQSLLNQSFRVSNIPSLIIFTLIYSICFGISLISTSLGEKYVNNYPDTTRFFNQLNQISIAATGVFTQIEIIYAIVGNSFFFDMNQTYFLQLFDQHIEEIDEFLEQISSLDTSNIITTTAFEDNLEKLMQSDVCAFLPEFKVETAQTYCDSLYNGVLRRGLQATLSTVRNALLNEQQISQNFTNQSYSLDFQLEIGLISFDAIQAVKTQFQEELVGSTNELISSITIINICALIVYILSVFGLFSIITKLYYKEFRVVIKFVLLLPQTSLFLDTQLDRNLRQIIIKNNLL